MAIYDLRVTVDRIEGRSVCGLQPGEEDWLEQETFVACPDFEERLIMRIERIGERRMRAADLT
jgi:hypothetical protein